MAAFRDIFNRVAFKTTALVGAASMVASSSATDQAVLDLESPHPTSCAGTTLPQGGPVGVLFGHGLTRHQLGPEFQQRAGAADVWLADHPSGHLIITGGMTNKVISEAAAAKAWMVAHGADGRRIILEPRALTTDENAEFSAALAKCMHPSEVDVISSTYHDPRAWLLEVLALQSEGTPVKVKAVWVSDGKSVAQDLKVHWNELVFLAEDVHRLFDFYHRDSSFTPVVPVPRPRLGYEETELAAEEPRPTRAQKRLGIL